MIEVFILSLIQGITEFLPISSSSHLILISNFFNFENENLSIDVSLHIGSFFAVVFYFNKDLVDFYNNKILFLKILISSIPVIAVGFFLVKSNYIDNLRDMKIIAWTTIIFGILLFISDKSKVKNDIKKNFNLKSALIIGLLQICSLCPGVSRSGIAITAARFLKFKRVDAAKISFLISIPILGAVSIYGLSSIILTESKNLSLINVVAILFSFIFSFITIKYFLKFLKKFNLSLFVIYRVILGSILLLVYYL
tara:strand:+ start:1937 stop:2695 length:759 start_codon:yes stop_codon:yes gene_type:complete